MSYSFVDGHIDLAYLQERGRDMTLPADQVKDDQVPAAVTLRSLAEGKVRTVIGTIFVQHRNTVETDKGEKLGPWCFSSDDEAYLAAMRQLGIYRDWTQDQWVHLLTGGESGRPQSTFSRDQINLIILMEGAAGLRRAEDLQTFYAGGVRLISLTWKDGTRWAGGDNQHGVGISSEGRTLLKEIDRLGMIHDVSHLSEASFWTVLSETQRPKVATHSNCRVLLPGKQHPERHLSDEQIKALVNVGGIIGINLFTKFLNVAQRAVITDVITHIRHMTDITGRDDFLAIGSDMDGGFSADELPGDLTLPDHLPRLLDALSKAGYSDAMIKGFAEENWKHFLGRHLSIQF